MSKFKEAALSAKPDDDAQYILSVAFDSTPLEPKRSSNDSAPLSNRAVKRVSMNPYPPVNFNPLHARCGDIHNPEYRSPSSRR